MSTDNVTPMSATWTQFRQTKLGLATVTIRPEGDLTEACVTIVYEDVTFRAEGTFSSEREAFLWAYGVKQTRNDRYAGYARQGDTLVEAKPGKGKIADAIIVQDALRESQSDYDNFALTKSSDVGDKVSLTSVKASTLLSEEEKSLMVSLFAKLGKVGKI